MDLVLNGNEISKAYLLNMRGEAVSYAEYGISYAHKFKSFFLVLTPPILEKPPKLPSDLITLWQGIARIIWF